ncbi:hypothetical protein [Paenibacillus silvae]|uniref:Uncharacterized protein n=1 Tax=Paenibacillus silvae TaxID=1325358 RepID=A0ABQ1ZL72_9BACL|nr:MULTISPECIES: hypothetical protein [Paenibacillus]MCK6078118.1 hypothetical protein [Paenibacillus silvae]MCK6152460.1 hypothetical protein [Paenibacillus silvae]MCK6271001.1 hypothetical protein [Paenibacillus silvae]GGH70222.1 hypothetical protein GCM10008014_54440 [Paenibacillus silvae]
MLLSITVVVVGCLMGVIDLPKLFKRKEWKEVIVYSVLLLTGVFFGIIAVNLWEFPSPLYIIIWIYKPVNQLLAYITGS